MRINVRLFAAFRERAGAGAISVDLPEGATVGDLVAYVAATSPALAPILRSARPVVNQEFAVLTEILKSSDEVALLPPVSGGAPRSPRSTASSRHNQGIP